MNYNFESKARIEKERDGALSFYDDRGQRIGTVHQGEADSLARVYHNLRDAHEAGYLTAGKYAQFERIFRKRLGYEPSAEERLTIKSRDLEHSRLVERLMIPQPAGFIEFKPFKKAA